MRQDLHIKTSWLSRLSMLFAQQTTVCHTASLSSVAGDQTSLTKHRHSGHTTTWLSLATMITNPIYVATTLLCVLETPTTLWFSPVIAHSTLPWPAYHTSRLADGDDDGDDGGALRSPAAVESASWEPSSPCLSLAGTHEHTPPRLTHSWVSHCLLSLKKAPSAHRL